MWPVVCETAGASALDSIRFFGRWDLRAPDKAITVNTGSYMLAQFSGTSIEARFDVSLNQPGSFIRWKTVAFPERMGSSETED